MTLLAEDVLLLLLDDASGKPIVDRTKLDRVLAGALLLELALAGQITPATEGESTRRGRLVARDRAPTGEDLLDRTLTRIAEGKPSKPERTVEQLSKGLRAELLSRLAERGLLHEHHDRILGVVPTTNWPAIDTAYEAGLRAELSEVLVGGAEPGQRAAALISPLAAVDAAAKVISAPDRRTVKRRAKQIADGEWAGAAVKKAVDAVNAAVAGSVVIATTVATTSS